MTPDATPGKGSASRPGVEDARRALQSRVVLTLSLTVALLFAGLFFHEKRTSVQRVANGVASSQQCESAWAQARQWQAVDLQRQKALREANALIGLMADPSTLRCVLVGDSGRGQVFVAPDASRMALFAFGLPEPEKGGHYRAWAQSASSLVSLGVLSGDGGDVMTLFLAPPASSISSVQVSLESSPSSRPAGDIVLEGACRVVPGAGAPGAPARGL